MRNSIITKTTLSLAALTCGCLILAGSALAQQPGGDQPAQPPRGGDQGGQGGRNRFGGGQGGGGMDWGAMARGMGGMQPASIFATGEYLFIVRGNTLYQYDVKTLKQIKKTQLEEEIAPAGGAGGGAPTPMPRPRPAPPAGGQDNPPPPAP